MVAFDEDRAEGDGPGHGDYGSRDNTRVVSHDGYFVERYLVIFIVSFPLRIGLKLRSGKHREGPGYARISSLFRRESEMLKLYMGIIGSLLLLSLTAGLAAEEPGRDVALLLDKFELLRPQDRELSLFTLDWEKTLKTALVRAARQERPVLLIVVRNSNGDIVRGHC